MVAINMQNDPNITLGAGTWCDNIVAMVEKRPDGECLWYKESHFWKEKEKESEGECNRLLPRFLDSRMTFITPHPKG